VTSVPQPESRRLLIARSRVTAALRTVLAEQGFIEAETPMLELADPGTAATRPFRIFSHALDMPLYLRTVAEFHLKRLVAAGFDRVFEMARSFRDEPPDVTHNLEYTLLEAYRAHDDYLGMRSLAQRLIRTAGQAVSGTTAVASPDRQEFDLSEEWAVVTVHEAVSRAVGEDVTVDTDASRLIRAAAAGEVPVNRGWTRDRLLIALYEQLVEPRTVGPTFYLDFPSSMVPLARPHLREPRLAEKWDLVIFGREVAAAYSELTDPDELRRRLEDQVPASAQDRKPLDSALLDAAGRGMPPTSGLVVGIERLLMTLTGATDIRDVVSFPLTHPGS
jgi:lysyl-tRNA synthetase class 2